MITSNIAVGAALSETWTVVDARNFFVSMLPVVTEEVVEKVEMMRPGLRELEKAMGGVDEQVQVIWPMVAILVTKEWG
jgi:hypothetical protein